MFRKEVVRGGLKKGKEKKKSLLLCYPFLLWLAFWSLGLEHCALQQSVIGSVA